MTLNGLKTLDEKTSAILSTADVGILMLDGLSSLEGRTAKNLSKWEESNYRQSLILGLSGIKKLDDGFVTHFRDTKKQVCF